LAIEVGAVQLSTRLRGVSPPVVRRLLVSEQLSLAEVHQILRVAFGWSDEHPYTFLIRGWRIGDPDRAAQLVRAGGRIDFPRQSTHVPPPTLCRNSRPHNDTVQQQTVAIGRDFAIVTRIPDR
jgi:hypothetical protein